MTRPPSIRARLIWGAALMLLIFLAGAGWTVQQAHADSVRAQRFARLQSTVYLLMAGAEVNAVNALVMPAGLAEPRLGLPGSGLYASVSGSAGSWQSASALGLTLPFQHKVPVGQWRYQELPGAQGGPSFLAAAYGVQWLDHAQRATLVFSVLEDRAAFDREIQAFARTLWRWLGGTGLLLLLTQTLLLRWGLRPLRQMTQEIQRIEAGQQTRVEGLYPREIATVTDNLNTLIDQQRARQTRFREALDDLAHSLKTPLAVIRSLVSAAGTAADDGWQQIGQQVGRMDDIVRHQLGRASAGGAARFAPALALAPLLQRVRDSLAKVYADKDLAFALDCAPELRWRIDEGDAFEMLGNVLDNAAKWARKMVSVRIWQEGAALHIRVSDDGPGFADLQALPARHLRLDEGTPGHGIGLSVVNALVASHHGTLTLSNTAAGGAQVVIVLQAA